MVKGSWLPRGTGWPLSMVSWLCCGTWGSCTGGAPVRRPGIGGVWVLVPWGQRGGGVLEKTSPILQGAPLSSGGHTQAPVSGWHLSPGPHWHGWEQLAPNIAGEQPEREARRQVGGGAKSCSLLFGLGAGHAFPFCGYLPSRGVQSSLGGRNSSHPGGGRCLRGGTGRTGHSWLPSVLEGTLQGTSGCLAGQGQRCLDERSVPSLTESAQPWSPWDTKVLNHSCPRMTPRCLPRAQPPTGPCTW